jgi:hypothetical protein
MAALSAAAGSRTAPARAPVRHPIRTVQPQRRAVPINDPAASLIVPSPYDDPREAARDKSTGQFRRMRSSVNRRQSFA